MAVYSIGSTVGSGSALIVGSLHTWPAVLLLLGLPGVPLAMLIFTLREPVRRTAMTTAAQLSWRSSYGALLTFIRTRPRFFLCHFLGFTLASLVVSGGVSWYPSHMKRSFGWGAGQIGVKLGLTLAAAGIVGKLLCGLAVDAMYRRGHRDAQLRWIAWCLLLALGRGAMRSAVTAAELPAAGATS